MTKSYFLQKYISILYLYKKLTSKVQKYLYTHFARTYILY